MVAGIAAIVTLVTLGIVLILVWAMFASEVWLFFEWLLRRKNRKKWE